MNKNLFLILLNKAFKEKSGGTEPSGTIHLTQNGIFDVKEYATADVEVPSYPPEWSEIGYNNTPIGILEGFNYAETIKNNWDSSITDRTESFKNDYNLTIFPFVDTSNVTTMYRMFITSSLISFPLVDTSNVTDMRQMFSQCRSLYSIPQLNTSKVTEISSMFVECGNLHDVPILDTHLVTGSHFLYTFSNCPNLTNESLNNILYMCAHSGVTNASYKKLSSVGLSTEQITVCHSLSNYQALLDAGWTDT